MHKQALRTHQLVNQSRLAAALTVAVVAVPATQQEQCCIQSPHSCRLGLLLQCWRTLHMPAACCCCAGERLGVLARLSSLRSLSLADSNVAEDALTHVGRCTRLTRLELQVRGAQQRRCSRGSRGQQHCCLEAAAAADSLVFLCIPMSPMGLFLQGTHATRHFSKLTAQGNCAQCCYHHTAAGMFTPA